MFFYLQVYVGSPSGLVHDRAIGQVRDGSGHRAGPIGGHEGRGIGHLGPGREPSKCGSIDLRKGAFSLRQHGTLSLLCVVFSPRRGEKTTHRELKIIGSESSILL